MSIRERERKECQLEREKIVSIRERKQDNNTSLGVEAHPIIVCV